MRAALRRGSGEPDDLTLADVPVPRPGAGELLIRVEAISIEGGDLLARRRLSSGADRIIGYSASGEVVEVGPSVETFEVGQMVTTFSWNGSHAEFRVAPAGTCWAVPDGLDPRVAATIPVSTATAALALRSGRLRAGETVLVTGAAGGVGIAAVQLAARAGARVVGTGSNRGTLEQLRPYGLDDAIVTTEGSIAAQVERLGGDGVDLLVDTIGGPSLVDALAAVGNAGRAVLIGVSGGHQAVSAADILHRRLTVIGCVLGAVMDEPDIRQMIDELLVLARDGAISVPIRAALPFSEIGEAHRLAEQRGQIGRIFVCPGLDER